LRQQQPPLAAEHIAQGDGVGRGQDALGQPLDGPVEARRAEVAAQAVGRQRLADGDGRAAHDRPQGGQQGSQDGRQRLPDDGSCGEAEDVVVDVEEHQQLPRRQEGHEHPRRQGHQQGQQAEDEHAGQVDAGHDARCAAQGLDDADLVRLLGDEGRGGVDDDDHAGQQRDDGQDLQHDGDAQDGVIAPMSVRLLIEHQADADALLGQLLFDGRRPVAGVGLAIGFYLDEQLDELPFREAEAGHHRLIDEEVGVAAELRRGDERMADEAGDSEGAVGALDFEDDLVAHRDAVVIAGDALHGDALFVRPLARLQFQMVEGLVGEVVAGDDGRRLPLRLVGRCLVADGGDVERFDADDAGDVGQGGGRLAVDELAQDDIEVRRIDRPVRLVHARQHLIGQAEHGPDGKHAGGNAEHRQQRARLAVPEVEPDLVPENAHF